jgi:hypothetical protein
MRHDLALKIMFMNVSTWMRKNIAIFVLENLNSSDINKTKYLPQDKKHKKHTENKCYIEQSLMVSFIAN